MYIGTSRRVVCVSPTLPQSNLPDSHSGVFIERKYTEGTRFAWKGEFLYAVYIRVQPNS